MAQITREQFIRGIEAVQRYRTLIRAVGEAMKAGGCTAPDDLGGEQVCDELTSQLSERCNDEPDTAGTMIEYMLYDLGGPVILEDGRRFMVKTPEMLWAYWEASETGPFAPPEQPTTSPAIGDGKTQAEPHSGEPKEPPAPAEEGESHIGAAEREVGQYVYRRIDALMEAGPGTAEGVELCYLAAIAAKVEEVGADHCGGERLAALPPPGKIDLHPVALAVRELEDAERRASNADDPNLAKQIGGTARGLRAYLAAVAGAGS